MARQMCSSLGRKTGREGKLGVCTILGKRQMLTKHDWLLEVLYLKIVVFMD